jgi:hypothetical protein
MREQAKTLVLELVENSSRQQIVAQALINPSRGR